MNVLEGLRRKHGFTDSEAAVADYLLEHMDQIPNLSINDLAEDAQRSKSTIVRLCRRLGLGGYRELKIEMTRALERQRADIQRIDPNRPFAEDSSTADITSAISLLLKQGIDDTYEDLSMDSIRQAAQLILDARHVLYYAIGDSCAALAPFAQLLYKIGVVCTSGLPMGDRGVLGRLLDSRDVAIIVTHSGNLVNTYQSTIDMLRTRGCKTILITANAALAERLMGTDCMFILPEGEIREERLATFYSLVCTQYVLSCIYAEAYSANYQKNLDNWQTEMQVAKDQ